MTRFSWQLSLVSVLGIFMLSMTPGCTDSADLTGSDVPVGQPVETVSVEPPGTYQRNIRVPEVGRFRCSLHVSQSYRSDTPAPLVLLLHFGYQGDQPDPFIGDSMIRLFKEAIEDCGGIALAPDVLGGTWIDGRNERAAVWLVRNVMSVYNIDSHRVVVAGFSMGGQGTWFIGSRHQDLFTGAVPIAARPAGSTSWTIPVCAVHSKADEVCPFTAAQQHIDAVRASGAFVEFLTVDDYGHYEMARYAPQFAQALKTVFEHRPR